MRILHTSDWHLGRMMGEFSMLDQQAQFVDWLLGVVASEHIELVVVAGDIFDRTNPSVEATELWSNTIRRVAALGVSLAVISGNHDEAIRIDAFAEITDLSGLYMRGGYRSAGQITRIELPTGPLQLVMLPYLSPTRASSTLTAAISKNAATNKLTHQRMLQHFTDQARSRSESDDSPPRTNAWATATDGHSLERRDRAWSVKCCNIL